MPDGVLAMTGHTDAATHTTAACTRRYMLHTCAAYCMLMYIGASSVDSLHAYIHEVHLVLLTACICQISSAGMYKPTRPVNSTLKIHNLHERVMQI